MDDIADTSIGMVGFGEAARAFVKGWKQGGSGKIAAYDIKLRDVRLAPSMEEAYRSAGVSGFADPGPALANARVVFCLVTADQVVAATQEAASSLQAGALWFDGNSCSPGAKRRAAEIVTAAGGRYVDLAIMAPVYPKLHRTPLLVAGEAAAEGAEMLRALDMRPEIVAGKVGDACAIKMIRSVMVKGLEALTAECLLAARLAGVEQNVMDSLQASDPEFDWARRCAYNFDRMMVHGVRRSAEMREVASTLRELGVPDRMASATAVWQEEIGLLKVSGGEASFAEHADAILAALKMN